MCPLYSRIQHTVFYTGTPELDLPKHRGRRPHNALSAAFVRSAKPGYYCDGNGLYLRVDRSGARRWEQRLRIQGRNRTLGLGGYRLVSLAEAREKAFMNRKIARSGGDPRTERHKVRDMPTFAEAAARVLNSCGRAGAAPGMQRTGSPACAAMRSHSWGHRPVGEITTADILAVLTPIWHDKQVTARRVRQRIGAVMKWAVAMGASAGQPRQRCARSSAWPTASRSPGTCARCLTRRSRGDGDGAEVARLPGHETAFEFLVLTAARSGEVRLAHWDEIDLEAREWTVPAERTKAPSPPQGCRCPGALWRY